ncbi:NAD(P)-binding protein, partial [Artomyces pyxidatus]
MTASKGVALVTGAGQGIGRAVALRLASDGFDVAVNDIASNQDKLETVVQELRAKGRRAHYVVADVSKESEVEGMVNEVVKELDSLDVMVANAGICLMKSILDTSTADFDRLISVNLRGTFLCYKYAGKQMIAQGRGGRIIGACSDSRRAAMLGAYVSTKFGIRGLTQVAAQEFGPHGITVNAYAPGPVKTPMFVNIYLISSPARQLAGLAALRKVAVPDDVAMLASFFASPNAHLITGQCV